MTIDEAIRHCEEMAEQEECFINYPHNDIVLGDLDIESRKHYVAEQRQIATWLRELKESLILIREYRAELNGWKEDPFGIIAEGCRTRSCKLCQWEEKCPYAGKYEYHPEDWRTENEYV